MSKWRKYQLTARKGRRSATHDFEEYTEGEAIIHAVLTILEKAEKSQLWARGEINLIDVESNEVIKSMPAK